MQWWQSALAALHRTAHKAVAEKTIVVNLIIIIAKAGKLVSATGQFSLALVVIVNGP